MGEERTPERARLSLCVRVLSIVALFYLAAIGCEVIVGIALIEHNFRLGTAAATAEFFFASLGSASIGWAVGMLKREKAENRKEKSGGSC